MPDTSPNRRFRLPVLATLVPLALGLSGCGLILDLGSGPDGGPIADAGLFDMDANVEDSGAGDAGSADAGSADSGSPDSGRADAGSADSDAGRGSPLGGPCVRNDDCTLGLRCHPDMTCGPAYCGDSIVDTDRGEECEVIDGSTDVPDANGCLPDCTYQCQLTSDCPSLSGSRYFPCLEWVCNANNQCEEFHFTDSDCSSYDPDQACYESKCQPDPDFCGNRVHDQGEECEPAGVDAAGIPFGDPGCTDECLYGCRTDDPYNFCDDGDACNGLEHCIDYSAGRGGCPTPDPPVTTDCYVCDPRSGPRALDTDHDGYYAEGVAGCIAGDDCDDHNAAVHPDAGDVTDGIDNDCDTLFDEDSGGGFECRLDEDRDGFGVDPSVVASIESVGDRCPVGYAPEGAAIDCHPQNADAYPGQPTFFSLSVPGSSERDFDYNCDGINEPEFPHLARCAQLNDNECIGVVNWQRYVPRCGDWNWLETCGLNEVGACAAVHGEQRRQACR